MSEAQQAIQNEPRILVVEDELVFAKAVKKRLTKAGYQVVASVDLASASAELKAELPSLMLLDMRLPDGSGLEFLSQLREQYGSQLPVIVMTAFGDVEDAVTAM